MENIYGILILLFILWLSHMPGFSVCLFNLGIHEISADVYMPVDHSSSGDSEKSDSSWNDCMSDEEQRSKKEPEDAEEKGGLRCTESHVLSKKKRSNCWTQWRWKRSWKHVTSQWESGPKSSLGEDKLPVEKGFSDKAKPLPHPTKDKLKGKGEVESPTVHLGLDSDSKSGLDIDSGKHHSA